MIFKNQDCMLNEKKTGWLHINFSTHCNHINISSLVKKGNKKSFKHSMNV